MKTVRELRDERAKKIADARALIEAADKEARGMATEEQAKYDGLMAEVDGLAADISRREKLEGVEAGLTRSAGRLAPVDDPSIGMSADDLKRYSVLRAVRAALSGDWRDAGLEREASDAVATKLGRQPRSFFIPFDWMKAETRDLIKGTAAQGGYLVGTELLAASFIDLLRNKMLVREAGATIMAGLVGDIAIPRQTGGATGYWVAENGAPTESQQALDQVAMSPKTVGAFTDISRKMLKQSSIDAELFVRNDLALVIALMIDLASLHGTGSSNQPTGVASQTGVNVVAIGANGGAITNAHVVDMETQVSIDNADLGRLAYLTNAAVRGKLKSTEKVSGYPVYVWGESQTPLNGYRGLVTNQVRSDLTKGTGTNLSAVFFGNWADLIIGMWGELDMLVDPFTASSTGAVRVIAFQDIDIAVRHPGSFAVILDAVTT